ncbi:MAG: hypothetical protein P1U67_10125 [Alcanivoracaceae bacterium]|nr:hypothetical protein [Alcanivoracaceae bacterium]
MGESLAGKLPHGAGGFGFGLVVVLGVGLFCRWANRLQASFHMGPVGLVLGWWWVCFMWELACKRFGL